MDLGTFYREFQNPPQLASLSLHTSSQSMADDLVNAYFFFSSFVLVLCVEYENTERTTDSFTGLSARKTARLREKHRWIWRFCGHASVGRMKEETNLGLKVDLISRIGGKNLLSYRVRITQTTSCFRVLCVWNLPTCSPIVCSTVNTVISDTGSHTSLSGLVVVIKVMDLIYRLHNSALVVKWSWGGHANPRTERWFWWTAVTKALIMDPFHL